MADRLPHSAQWRERLRPPTGDPLRGVWPAGEGPAARAWTRKESLAEEFRRNRARREERDSTACEPYDGDPRAWAEAPVDGGPRQQDSPEAYDFYAAGRVEDDASPAPAGWPQQGEGAAARGFGADGGERPWRPLIDPARLISGIANARKIIAATTIAGGLLGVMIALSTPKTYFSAAELLADPRDLNLVERDLTQGGISNEATLAIVDNQVRIITSGTVLTHVVQKLNLDADPEFNGTGASGLIGTLSSVRSLFSDAGEAGDPDRRTALAVRNLGRALTVERGGRTFVVLVGANTRDPEKSALIANTTSRVFLERYGQIQSASAGRASGELSAKLDELRAGVEAAERKVETFKAENDLIDAQGRLITDDEILKLNDQLGVARARTLEIKARADSMRGASADAIIGGSLPEELSSATIQELRGQYSNLRSEADRLAVRLGPRHPQLLAAQAQLEGLRDQLGAEIRRIVASTQTELKRAVELEQQLSSRLAQLKVRQGDVSTQMVTLRELERDVTAKRAVYEAYLLRAKETNEQQGINSANISIISEAVPPLEPSSTSRTVMAVTGAALGLLLGIGIGAARGSWEGLRDTLGLRRRRAAIRRRPTEGMPEDAPWPAGTSGPQPSGDASSEAPVEPDQPFADASAQSRQEAMHRPYASEYDYPDADQPQYPASDRPYAAAPYPQPPMGPPAAGANPAYYGYPAVPAGPAPDYAYPPAYPYPQPPMGPPAAGMNPAYYGYQPAPAAYGYPQPGHAMAPGQVLAPGQQLAPGQGPIPGQPPAYPYAQPGPMPHWQPPPPHPAMAYPAAAYPQPAARPERYGEPSGRAAPPATAADSSMEEIRASLRECRDVLRELAQHRAQRRAF